MCLHVQFPGLDQRAQDPRYSFLRPHRCSGHSNRTDAPRGEVQHLPESSKLVADVDEMLRCQMRYVRLRILPRHVERFRIAVHLEAVGQYPQIAVRGESVLVDGIGHGPASGQT